MPGVGQIDTTTGIETNPSPLIGGKRTVLLTEQQFQARLAELAKAAGSNAETGRRLGVTGQFIDYLIAGKRKPGKKLLSAIGARKRVMIEIDVEGE